MGRTFRNKDKAQTERLKSQKRNRVKSRRVIIEPRERNERPERRDRDWNGDW